jgi:cation diffusion facilitator CzcD-associated flavoprotein CzcO
LAKHPAQPLVVIIGAGFSGIGLGIKLKKAGHRNFVILERADGVGGCWRLNTYPGVACDIPSRIYSFSFEQNPNWSRSFSGGEEIRRYLERCANKHGLMAHLRTGKTVVSVHRDGEVWNVRTDDGAVIKADVVVPALGPLSDPKMPEIEGLESFAGGMCHAARWDHSLDLKGKRVGLIGSAASAAQIVPEVAKIASSLTVFMRTPNWVIPRADFPYSPLQKAMMKVPFLMPVVREYMFRRWDLNHAFIQRGNPVGRLLGQRALAGMKSQIPEGPLREALIPNYAPGCKRLIMSSTYLPALQRPNVQPEMAKIDRVMPKGVRTEDGREHEFDILVLATGYKNFDISESIDVVGPGGINLREVWKSRAVTLRTVGVPGFPNMFIMMGPNTGSGHHSATNAIEAQAKYIKDCIITLWKRGLKSMTPKLEPAEAFYELVQERLSHTVLTDNCQAWYKNGEGGKVHSIWPGKAATYTSLLKAPALDEFDLA